MRPTAGLRRDQSFWNRRGVAFDPNLPPVPLAAAKTFDPSADLGPTPSHNLLSNTHPDTLPGTVVRGDVIVGNSTPKWARLPKGINSNQFLKLTGFNLDPSWAQPDFSNLSGKATGAQLTSPFGNHGHVPNSGFNPLITAALGADKTITGTTPTAVGIQISATGRNVSAGLNAFFGAILSVQSPLGTGSLFVYIDGAQYAGPYPVGNATFGTVTIYVPFFSLDANVHTFEIFANADTALHTIVFSGTTYQTISFVMDFGSGLNIA